MDRSDENAMEKPSEVAENRLLKEKRSIKAASVQSG
jgi:hypothetical protein